MADLCNIEECKKESRNGAWCSMHEARIRRHGDPNAKNKPGLGPRPVEKTLQMLVPDRPSNGCWVWRGHSDAKGYGRVSRKGKQRQAHRVIYEHFKGPIPDDLILRHTCDNPPCVNPSHLLTGTIQDNNQDAVDRMRHAFGERVWSSKLTEEQVIEARTLFATGKFTKKYLASKFGLTYGPMSQLLAGETWKHLPGARDAATERMPGELYGSTRLTESQVLKIRTKYASGSHSQASLAIEFGLTATPMSQLIRGVTWKHVPMFAEKEIENAG